MCSKQEEWHLNDSTHNTKQKKRQIRKIVTLEHKLRKSYISTNGWLQAKYIAMKYIDMLPQTIALHSENAQ
jgi:hypothetical protein